jgi:hypothetical protein
MFVLSPLAWMCLPMFKANDGESVTLISVIMGIIGGGFDFSNPSYLFPVITMVCIIVFSLVVIISSLFSLGKKAFLRNTILSIINLLVLAVCIILTILQGANIGVGAIIVVVTYIIENIMHKLVDKKINK